MGQCAAQSRRLGIALAALLAGQAPHPRMAADGAISCGAQGAVRQGPRQRLPTWTPPARTSTKERQPRHSRARGMTMATNRLGTNRLGTNRLGIIMHGVTGRMGYNQHLVRSILAIRDQGGVLLANGDRVMPDPILVG